MIECQGCKAITELELLCRTCIGAQAEAQGRDAIIGRDKWRARAEKAEAERDLAREEARHQAHEVDEARTERDKLRVALRGIFGELPWSPFTGMKATAVAIVRREGIDPTALEEG